jgi:hypothetical protein
MCGLTFAELCEAAMRPTQLAQQEEHEEAVKAQTSVWASGANGKGAAPVMSAGSRGGCVHGTA